MSIILSDINASCASFSPRIDYGGDAVLNDAEIITSSIRKFMSDTLYVGKLSDIAPSASISEHAAFLLIGRGTKGLSGKHPLITVESRTDILSIFTAVKELFAGRNRYEKSSALLLESLIQGQGVGEIVETAASLVGNPAVLVDAGFRVLAHSRVYEVNDPLWKKNIEAGFCTWEFISEVKKLDEVVRAPKSSDPFYVSCGAGLVRRITSKIIIGRNTEGFLIFFESAKLFTAGDSDIIRLASKVISQELKKNPSFRKGQGAPFGYFFNDIMDQDLSDSSIRERAKAAGIAPSRCAVICADISSFSQDRNEEYIRDKMESFFPGSLSAFYDDTVVLLCRPDNKAPAVAVSKEAESYAESSGLRIGISRIFSDSALIRKGYLQAKDAASIAGRLSLSDHITSYESVLFYDMISKIPSGYDLSEFCHPAVLMLREYDQHHTTDYFLTLKEFLAAGCSINRAAKRLFIHRNTILYRMEKIAQITGVSLSDSAVRFLLESSFRILDYQDHR
jgi:hypothetical protein